MGVLDRLRATPVHRSLDEAAAAVEVNLRRDYQRREELARRREENAAAQAEEQRRRHEQAVEEQAGRTREAIAQRDFKRSLPEVHRIAAERFRLAVADRDLDACLAAVAHLSAVERLTKELN